MSATSWDVIIWKDDKGEDTIDYVPSSWANKEKTSYKYPKGLTESRIGQFILKCKDLPEPNYEWTQAVLKKGNLKTLKKAKEYTRNGQYTSNFEISSSSEGERSEVRKKRKPKRFESDNVEQDDAEEASDCVSVSDENESFDADENTRKSFKTPPVAESQQSSKNNKKRKLDESGEGVAPSLRPECSQKSNQGERAPVNKPFNVQKPPMLHKAFSLGSKNDIKNVDCNLIRTMQSDIADIKYEIKSLRRILEPFSNDISLLVTKLKTVSMPAAEYDELNGVLPCEDNNAVQDLEAKLQDEETRQKLVTLLYLVGGDDVHKTMYLIMGKVLGKKIACEYSGQGKKKKMAFNKLKLHKVVIDAVRKRYPTVTEAQMNKEISLYLATSKSRLPPSEN